MGERKTNSSPPREYSMNFFPPSIRSAKMTFNLKSSEKWKLFHCIPHLPSSQQFNLKVTSSHPSSIYEVLPFNCTIYSIEAEGKKKKKKEEGEEKEKEEEEVTVEYEWTFRQRFLDFKRKGKEFIPAVPISTEERKTFLQKDRKYNFDDERFKKWQKDYNLWIQTSESPIDFAYRGSCPLKFP